MDKITNTLLAILFYQPLLAIILGTLLVISLFAFFSTADHQKREKRLKILIIIAISFRVVFGFALSAGQYVAWSQSALTKLLLPPNQPLSYLLFYAWGRFWTNAVIILGISLVWYFILKGLQRYRSALFEAGEMKLGFLCAFLVGWPSIVVFIPLFFITIVIVSLVRKIFLKKHFTTIGIPLAISAIVAFVCAAKVIEWLHLGVLNI